jgi:hypothetical protein
MINNKMLFTRYSSEYPDVKNTGIKLANNRSKLHLKIKLS